MPNPQSVDEAVQILLTLVPESEQSNIAEIPEDELICLHLGMGMWVRNNLGLWKGIEALMADTGALDVDGAASVIGRAFWLHVREARGVQQP
jgi:hypothetical protein